MSGVCAILNLVRLDHLTRSPALYLNPGRAPLDSGFRELQEQKMDTKGLRREPIKCKMKPTGLYRYFDGTTLVGKDCTECRSPREVESYHKAKGKPDGIVSKCRDCLSERASKAIDKKYSKSGAQVAGWVEELHKDPVLVGLDVVLARRYRGWQNVRFYFENGSIAGKVCPSCKEAKVVGSFSKNSGHSDGLSTYCKICGGVHNKEYLKIRFEDDPEYYKNKSAVSYTKYFIRTDDEIIRSRDNLHPGGTKVCRVCRENLEFNQYDVARGRSDGLALDCKNCKKTKRKRVCTEYWNEKGVPLRCYLSSCVSNFEEIDHVVPTSLDGPDELSNMLPMCSTHNRRKHGTLLPLWLLENHPDDYEKTIDAVTRYGVDPWGEYVPVQT